MRKFFILIIVIVIFFSIDRWLFHRAVEESLRRVFEIPQSFFREKILKNFRLRDEIAILRQEQRDAIADQARIKTLENENDLLRRQLGVVARRDISLLMVGILGITRTSLVSTITIDRGTADGVMMGMTVIAAGNILVGKVEEVFENTARVMMIDDSRFSASVHVGQKNILAESRGLLKNMVALRLIARSESVAVDDLVVTSGLDVFYPGLVLARVSSVVPGTSILFQDVEGGLVFDFSENPSLFVIVP